MWIKFVSDAMTEARRVGLLPGDGIAQRSISIMEVAKPDAKLEPKSPVVIQKNETMQGMVLLSMDESGYTAKDPDGVVSRCQWKHAVAYEKRHDG